MEENDDKSSIVGGFPKNLRPISPCRHHWAAGPELQALDATGWKYICFLQSLFPAIP